MEEKSKRSRKLREWYTNAMYHITSRGNRRSDIYKDEEDYVVYLNTLKESLKHYSNNYDLISYCLMTNHVHLQVKTKEKHIKYFMSRLNGFYAKYFKNKYNCVGHLFQERYGSEIILLYFNEENKYSLYKQFVESVIIVY